MFKNSRTINKIENRKKSTLAQHLSNRIFFILLVIEAIILILVGYFFFIRGVVSELGAVKNDLLPEQQNNYAVLMAEYNDKVDSKDLFLSLDKSLVNKSKMVLPDDPELSNLVVNLDSLAKSNGFSLANVDFVLLNNQGQSIKSTEKIEFSQYVDLEELKKMAEQTEQEMKNNEDKSLKTVEMKITIKGSGYAGFKNLLLQIQKNIRLLDVVSFSFSPEDETFSLILRAYYF